MPKRVRSRDVAELAGVSRTTVSFVLNDVPGMRISAETRQKVLNAAKELDYHPDASARRLVTGRTQILAYVERQSPEQAFADAFMPQVLRGVHDAASMKGYEILFAPIPLESTNGRFTGLLRGRHVDGIILSGPRTDDLELRRLVESMSPIVLQGQWPEVDAASVDVDNVKAARLATEHLIRLGHKRLGMIVHAPASFTASKSRVQGFREAITANGLQLDEDLIVYADFTPGSGEAALHSLLRSNDAPTALFVSSDTVAIGVIRAAQALGFSLPDDLAIVGFDDIPISDYLDPPLTTVRLPAYGIGWAAADLLIRMMDDDEGVRDTTVLLDTELIIRESCGA
jgi:DNA-binding LacI/PurR family transcriptional regulator